MSDNSVKISLKVQPNAGKNEVIGRIDGVWRIKIAAPPDKGKANRHLIEFLSEVLKIKKDHIAIVKGHTIRNKLVSIQELAQSEIDERLSRKI